MVKSSKNGRSILRYICVDELGVVGDSSKRKKGEGEGKEGVFGQADGRTDRQPRFKS